MTTQGSWKATRTCKVLSALPHHLPLEAHCIVVSTWALELAGLTWKSSSLTHWWVKSGWAPHSIWGSVFYWPLCYWGVEMVRLPSYGVIKMYKCKHDKFQMTAAILQRHICFVVIIIIVIPRWIFPLYVAVGFPCAQGLLKKADPKGQCLAWPVFVPVFTLMKPVPVAVAALSKPTMKCDPAGGLRWVRLDGCLLHNSNDFFCLIHSWMDILSLSAHGTSTRSLLG